RAQRSLAATTAQLEALRRANVVDAGAQGFVDLLQGITDYVRDGSLRTGPAGGAAPAVPDAASPASFSAAGVATAGRRWCTECLVSGPAIDRRRLREALAGL